jgi:hypothetical protein
MGISFSLLPNRAAGNFSSPSLNNLRMPGQERSCMRSESRKNGLLQPWHSIDFGMRKNVREFGLTELMIEFHNRLASSPSTRALHCVKSKIFKSFGGRARNRSSFRRGENSRRLSLRTAGRLLHYNTLLKMAGRRLLARALSQDGEDDAYLPEHISLRIMRAQGLRRADFLGLSDPCELC